MDLMFLCSVLGPWCDLFLVGSEYLEQHRLYRVEANVAHSEEAFGFKIQ